MLQEKRFEEATAGSKRKTGYEKPLIKKCEKMMFPDKIWAKLGGNKGCMQCSGCHGCR